MTRLLGPKLVDPSINPARNKHISGAQRPGIHKHTWIQAHSALTLDEGVSKAGTLAHWYLLGNTVLLSHRKQAVHPPHSSMKLEVRGLWNSLAVPPSCRSQSPSLRSEMVG